MRHNKTRFPGPLQQGKPPALYGALRMLMPMLSLFALVACLTGCGSNSNIHVTTDYDPQVDFLQYQTFACQPGRILLHNGATDTDDTLLDNRIRNAVTEQLAAKGMKPVTLNPDLIVTYIAGAHRRQDIEDEGPDLTVWGFAPHWYGPHYYGVAGWWAPGYERFWVRDYTEGTLIVDLIDAHRHQLVWRAYASGEINKVPDQKILDRAAAQIFKGFPPQPKQ